MVYNSNVLNVLCAVLLLPLRRWSGIMVSAAGERPQRVLAKERTMNVSANLVNSLASMLTEEQFGSSSATSQSRTALA